MQLYTLFFYMKYCSNVVTFPYHVLAPRFYSPFFRIYQQIVGILLHVSRKGLKCGVRSPPFADYGLGVPCGSQNYLSGLIREHIRGADDQDTCVPMKYGKIWEPIYFKVPN